MRGDATSDDFGGPDTQHEQTIRSAAETVAPFAPHPEEAKRGNVDVTTRRSEASGHETVAKEAQKGYGLLVLGIRNARARRGGFTEELTQIADGFEGALAIVAGTGPPSLQALRPSSRILVPVNGTEASRRAVEIALVIARSNDAGITALYVTSGAQNPELKRRRRGSHRNEEAVLKEVTELADRYDRNVRTALHVSIAADGLSSMRRDAAVMISLFSE
jgi:hypothetical protein